MSTWITITGWTLLHFVWQGAAIGAMAACGLALARTAHPNRRYILATAALALTLLAPVVTATWMAASERPRLVGNSAFVPAPSVVSSPPPTGAFTFDMLPTASSAVSYRRVTRIFPVVVAVWLIGVIVLLVRLIGGWWRVRRLHRTALEAPPSQWQLTANRLAARLGIRQPIHVRDSIVIHSPMVIGWWRPVVLLPVTAFSGLTPDQAEAVLTHELAHVGRHDYLVNLLQHVAETVLFYHPAVWWLSTRVRIERELCCDAIAVACGHDALDYASALTSLEEARTTNPVLAVAATSGALLERIRRILEMRPDGHRSATHAILTTLIVVMLVAGVGGGYRWSIRTVHADDLGVVGTINGESITEADVDHFRPLHGEPADTPLASVLVQLVDERLLVQRGQELGFTVTPFELQRSLAGVKAQNGVHSDAELQNVLATQHLTIADLIQHLQRSRTVFHVGLVESGRGLVISDDEVQQYFDSHLGEFPLQTFDLAKPALVDRLRLIKMGQGIAPESYLQSLRAAATLTWKRADVQRAYADGLSQRASSERRSEIPPAVTSAVPQWSLHATRNVDIFFTADLSTQLGRVEEEADRAYEHVSRELRHDLANRPTLVVFATIAAVQAAASGGTLPKPSGGAERMLTLVPLDQTDEALRALVTHEITHQFEADILPRAIMTVTPVWILEGLSEYEGGTWAAGDQAILREFVRANAVPALTMSGDNAPQASPRVGHTLGHAAFELIAARWGAEGIRQLLMTLRRGSTDREALYQQAFRISPEEMDRAFDAYLRDRFPAR